jgi:hypothetical protein
MPIFKKNRKIEQESEPIVQPLVSIPTPPTPTPTPEPCNPPCVTCLRVGCCRTCLFNKVVKYESPEAYVVSCDGFVGYRYQESKAKVGQPVLAGVIGDKPCPNYRCKYLRNLLTGEILEL